MRPWLIVVIALGLAALAAGSPEGTSKPPTAGEHPRYHRDAQALELATLAVSKAILRSDPATARKELDRMAELAPPLGHDQKSVYGPDLFMADGSLQITLTNSREYAVAGTVDELFNEFVWVQRTCLYCHGVAGVVPPR